MKIKKHGGRQRGQLAKAHKSIPNEVAAEWQKFDVAKQSELRAQGITPEKLEEWRHAALASTGDFSGEVTTAAGCLGKLVNRWKEALSSNRINLELNQRKIEIPLPFLPGTFSGLKSLNEDQIRELKFSPTELRYLSGGHDAIWAMQRGYEWEALRLLSALIQAAAKNDTNFFKELYRRICCDAPLDWPVERVTSALVSLKACYFTERWQGDHQGVSRFYERETPLLVPVLKHPPGHRPPLTVPQIDEWVWAFAKVRLDERSLKRHADAIELPREHRRGRQKK